MTAKLATFVHVADEHGATHVFGPDDKVPEWAARKVVNPKAWVDGNVPYPYDESVERAERAKRLRAELAALEAEDGAAKPAETAQASTGDGPPPKGGAGSGAQEWRAYAARKNVEVPADASREQVIDALTAANVPTE